MIRRVFQKVKKLRVICLSIIVTIVIILFLSWIYDEYNQQTMLLWLAILIAAFAAVINALSLDKTRQTLDLTRQSVELMGQSTRPFLSVADVRYSPTPSGNPRLLLSIRNAGILPAYRIIIESELFIDVTAHGPHQRIEQPPLKPDESVELVFTLPLYVREMIPTEKSYLIISTQLFPDIGKNSFYHTERHYSIPPDIKRLDQSFNFVFRRGGWYD